MEWFKKILPYLIIIVVIVLLRTFVITPIQVDGASMNPTLANNELVLLKKYDHSLKRFDIVIFQYRKERLIKRVIGLPGEKVKYENHQLYINEEPVEDKFANITHDFSLTNLGFDRIPDDYYLVLGDNRTDSTDSRVIGLIPKKDIVGSTSFGLFPFDKFGFIH